MRETTLCYIEQNGCYLMLHRTKKERDENAGKWIGVGGHLEAGETPQACLLREVREETGLTLTRWRARGVVDFVSDEWGEEKMHLFTADGFTGCLRACDEGDLAWVEKNKINTLPLWQGDQIFLNLLARDAPRFHLLLRYEGETLKESRMLEE